MRREERVTVQGPVKEQQPDGMSHRGGKGACPQASVQSGFNGTVFISLRALCRPEVPADGAIPGPGWYSPPNNAVVGGEPTAVVGESGCQQMRARPAGGQPTVPNAAPEPTQGPSVQTHRWSEARLVHHFVVHHRVNE